MDQAAAAATNTNALPRMSATLFAALLLGFIATAAAAAAAAAAALCVALELPQLMLLIGGRMSIRRSNSSYAMSPMMPSFKFRIDSERTAKYNGTSSALVPPGVDLFDFIYFYVWDLSMKISSK